MCRCANEDFTVTSEDVLSVLSQLSAQGRIKESRSPYSIKNSKRRDLCLVSGLYLCDDNFKVVVFNPENLMRKVSL